MSRPQFAVVQTSDGALVDVVSSLHDAEDVARHLARGKPVLVDAPAHDGDVEFHPNASMPEHALRASGLSPVTLHDIERVTGGFRTLDFAHRQLRRTFPTSKQQYDTPEGMALALLGQNYKLAKAESRIPCRVFGLSLLPHWLAWSNTWAKPDYAEARSTLRHLHIERPETPQGIPNFCVGSSASCRQACLVGTGHNTTTYNIDIKRRRTIALMRYPAEFLALLWEAIQIEADHAAKVGRMLFVRLNVFSDIPWELVAPWLFDIDRYPHQNVRFYDYTKVFGRAGRAGPSGKLPAYDLTFSYSGSNQGLVRRELDAGKRVAVVLLLPGTISKARKSRMPETILDARGGRFLGQPLVDGDVSDVRIIDPAPSVVGLRYKLPRGVDVNKLGAFVVRVRKIDGQYVVQHTPEQTDALDFGTDSSPV